MREILGRRLQRLRSSLQSLRPLPSLWSLPTLPALRPLQSLRLGSRAASRPGPAALHPGPLDAALMCATAWRWPVLPGVGRVAPDSARCACPDPDCVVPGAHPFDPGLLAATTDPRMVGWWWTNRPAAPLLLATGGHAPCAVSLPATAAARALVRLDQRGMRLGPVVATPTRWSLLVAPYSLERLGELLYAKDHVPSSLRFHGEGGYLLLPPSAASCGGQVRWEREPSAQDGPPWLPEIEAVVDALVEASTGAPGGGSRLAY